jgi:enoyl-CoA hydratase/carnithine racemase
MTDTYANLLVEISDDVLWVRINRPRRRNALSGATLVELGRVCAEQATRQSLKAAVLTGAGTEAFAAGGDLKELSTIRSAEKIGAFFDMASEALDQVRRFPVPVVAALNGWALGGGAELALACDYRVAVPDASIGYVQAKLNICCGFGGGADFMRVLGSSTGMMLAMSGQILDARSALAAGLIDAVAADGEPLESCIARFLQPITQRPAQVLRAYKAMAIAQRFGPGWSQLREQEREWFVRTWTHPDHWAVADALAGNKTA